MHILKLRCVVLIALATLLSSVASAQYHFDPNTNPSLLPDLLIPNLDSIASSRLADPAYRIRYNVYWNGDDAVLSGDLTSNGYTSNLTLGANLGGVVVESNFVNSLTYQVSIIQSQPGEALLALTWSRQDLNGQVTSGTKLIGHLFKHSYNQILPTSNGSTSGGISVNRTHAPTAPSGSYQAYSFSTTIGYMGSDGAYHVVAVTQTVLVWVANSGLPGDEDVH